MLCYHKFLYLGVKDKKTLRKIWPRPVGPAFSRLEAGAKMITRRGKDWDLFLLRNQTWRTVLDSRENNLKSTAGAKVKLHV